MGKDNLSIINGINARNEEVFGNLFTAFYDEYSYFARKLFKSTEIHYEDVIQDAFVKIWERRWIKFESISHFKSYIYLSLKNSYKDYHRHRKHILSHKRALSLDDEAIFTYMVEAETLSLLSSIDNMLPEKCSQVFRLHIEGWNVKEIAKRFGIKESTVYNQKNRAIAILKKNIENSDLL